MNPGPYDLVVIGTGPAGQKAAIAAAKLGKKVAVIDRKEMVGGVCLHTGTIPSKTLREAIVNALSEQDETAEICRDEEGNPEPDPEVRDTENVPLKEDIQVYFDREVKPHVPDAWINNAIVDHKDGRVGRVGYEINFNRYFYKYQPPRSLESIEADIKTIEQDIVKMLGGITGSIPGA